MTNVLMCIVNNLCLNLFGLKMKNKISFQKFSCSLLTKRKLEFIGLLISSVLIISVTISNLILKRISSDNVNNSCSESYSKYQREISGTVFPNGSVLAEDGMLYPLGSYWTSDDGTLWGCPCLVKRCLYECFEQGKTKNYSKNNTPWWANQKDMLFDIPSLKTYKKTTSCEKLVNLEETNLEDNHFIMINGNICDGTQVVLDPEKTMNLFFLEDGSLFINSSNKLYWDSLQFCLQTNGPKVRFKICLQQSKPEWMFLLSGVGMLISAPFLLATMVVHALLPSLRNLHGKALMCHVTSLTAAYSCLALIYLVSTSLPPILCKVIAFLTEFSLLTSFFWLNVMCFDIWWVFSGLKPMRGSQSEAEQVKFYFYSLYAWGCPLLLLATSLLMEFSPGIPPAFRPQMGVVSCFFKEKDTALLYLYLPVGVLVYLNTVMFVITSLRFKNHSKSTQLLLTVDNRHGSRSYNSADLKRFSLYLKLSLLMGVNWMLEVLSFYFEGPPGLWLISDMANALQGCAIFYLSVCSARVLQLLRLQLPSLLSLTPPRTPWSSTTSRGLYKQSIIRGLMNRYAPPVNESSL